MKEALASNAVDCVNVQQKQKSSCNGVVHHEQFALKNGIVASTVCRPQQQLNSGKEEQQCNKE